MPQNLGGGFVEVRPSFDKFDSDLKRGVQDALDRVAAVAQSTGEDIEASFAESASTSAASLDSIGQGTLFLSIDDTAAGIGEGIESAFAEAARVSIESLDSIGAGAFADLDSDAARVGEGIETAFAEAARESDASLEGIGGSEVFGEIGRDAERAGERVERAFAEAGRESDRSLGRIGGAIGIIGGAIAAAGIGIALTSAVGLASDLGESVNAVNVTFLENAEGVRALAENANTALGLTETQFNALAVQFSSFADKIAGPGGDTVGVIDEITSRAADFASVMNLEVADAAQIFQAGLAGETEGLKRFGIDLSDSAIKAFAAANGIGNVGEELTEQEKVLARYGALMEQTAKTEGDFANTQDGLANGMRILGATAKEAGATFGNALLPGLEGVVGSANQLVTDLAAGPLAASRRAGADQQRGDPHRHTS